MENKSDKSIRTGDVIGGVVSSGYIGGNVSVNSINKITSEERINLAEAAAEIQQLLDQLSQTYPTTTTADKANVAAKAIEEIEKKPNTKKKIIKALRAGGTATLMEITNNPIVRILAPMLQSLLDDGVK